jgi:hypothetical protein
MKSRKIIVLNDILLVQSCCFDTYSLWLTLRCSYAAVLCHFHELLCCQILQATHQMSSQLTSEDHLWWQSTCGTWHLQTSHPGPLNHQSASKHMFQVIHLYVEVLVYTTKLQEKELMVQNRKFGLIPSLQTIFTLSIWTFQSNNELHNLWAHLHLVSC